MLSGTPFGNSRPCGCYRVPRRISLCFAHSAAAIGCRRSRVGSQRRLVGNFVCISDSDPGARGNLLLADRLAGGLAGLAGGRTRMTVAERIYLQRKTHIERISLIIKVELASLSQSNLDTNVGNRKSLQNTCEIT